MSFALSSVVLCLNFRPFIVVLLFPCQVFFLYLFIRQEAVLLYCVQ
jgi:hypothetical protein